ncbi:restriction endonuclease subunit S, partial [Psittacicella hinzii]
MHRNSYVKRLLQSQEIVYKYLDEISVVKSGVRTKSDQGSKQRSHSNPFPVYGAGGLDRYIDKYVHDQTSVILPGSGSLEKLFYVTEPFYCLGSVFYTVIDTEFINPRYLYYYLSTINLLSLSGQSSGRLGISRANYNKLLLPIPPLNVQCQLIDDLDKFENLHDALS